MADSGTAHTCSLDTEQLCEKACHCQCKAVKKETTQWITGCQLESSPTRERPGEVARCKMDTKEEEEDVEVDCKDEEMDMMVEAQEELDKLLSLQVQFGHSPHQSVVTPEEPVQREKKSSRLVRRKVSSSSTSTSRQHVQVSIGSAAIKMWSDVGASQGLTSDPDIAAFLLQHYESTKKLLCEGSECSVCHQPLTLICLHCNQPVPEQPSAETPTRRAGRTVLHITPVVVQPWAGATRPVHTSRSPSPDNKPPLLQVQVPVLVQPQTPVSDQPQTPELIQPRTAKKGKKKGKKKRQRTVKKDGVAVTSGTCNMVPDDCICDGDDVADIESVDNNENDDAVATPVQESWDCADDVSSDAQVDQMSSLLQDEKKQQKIALAFKHVKPVATAEGKAFRCKVCSHTYTRACSLKAHMRKHTGDKPFQCQHCHAAFSLSGSLIVHLRTHTGDKPYVCEDCGRNFAISSALKQHRRQHTGEKPYHCNICFSKYSRSDSLKVHMRTHSGDRPFICEECGADFSRLYCLLAHKKKHSGERPFQCTECLATFTQSGKLTIHMRKHTGDRPFQCERCGASFTQSDRLKTHLRIHSGEKPYKCEECGKGFSHPHSLKVHSRAHTGDRPYKCDVCSLTFADPSYFRRHKAKHANSASAGVGGAFRDSVEDSVSSAFAVPMSLPVDFVTPVSSAERLGMLPSTTVALSVSSTPSAMHVSFPVTNTSAMSSADQNCFGTSEEFSVPSSSTVPSAGFSAPTPSSSTVPSVGFSVPSSSTVPLVGFSVPSCVGVGFPMPASSAVTADGTDATSSINAADPFSFLRSALHCNGSFLS